MLHSHAPFAHRSPGNHHARAIAGVGKTVEESPLLNLDRAAHVRGLSERPAPAAAHTTDHSAILRMQPVHGNHHVQRLLRTRAGPAIRRCGATPCNCPSDAPTRHATAGVPPLDDDEQTAPIDFTPQPIQRVAAESMPTLVMGSSSPAVTELQQHLADAGFDLAPDGQFGPQTRQSVVAFQTEKDLAPDGIVGPATWSALLGTAAPAPAEPGGDGPPLVGGTFPGLGPLAPVCGYQPGEREASAKSDGRVDPPSGIGPTVNTTALLWDFQPGRTTVRGNHLVLIGQLVADLKLDSPTPVARVQLLEGHTDCVDTEGINAPIRAGRAAAARFEFVRLGALETNVGIAKGATQGATPGSDATVEGRARNRSVLLFLLDTPPEDSEDPGGQDPSCIPENDVFSHTWGFRGTHEVMFGLGPLGKFQLDFDLENGTSGCIYCCTFVGNLEGGGVSFSQSLPGVLTPFATAVPMKPSEFNGAAARVESQSAFFFEDGFLKFHAIGTDPVEITISGIQGGFGAQVGIVNSEGNVFVRPCDTA